DMDQFLAAVEVRRRPELAGRPVVVGGDGDPTRPRQVVATASYEARAHGVRSGMPLRTALRRCPDAVFLASDRAAYDAASEEVMATLRSFPVVVEVWGWDEAFVGGRTDDPEALAVELRAAVLDRTGLSCAIGIGESRLLAKTAVRAAKPGGIARLTRREWAETWGPRPVTEVWGIGSRIALRLEGCGVRTIDDLARADADALAAEFGPRIGPGLKVLGLGGGTDPLDGSPRVAKGRSKEVTFTTDITDPVRVAAEVDGLARAVAEEVVADGRQVTHVAVKIRTASFWTRTKIAKLADGPTTDPAVVAAQAAVVLGRFGGEVDRPIRLLGVRVALEDLTDPVTRRRPPIR
ncbi:MAG TPA: DNA polymerase IV, partial [Iamia sp.]